MPLIINIRHDLAEIPSAQLGGVAYDVDRDGWIDLIAGGFWFKNSQNPKEESFIRYQYDSRIKTEIHDIVVKDLDGDSVDDVLVLGDREGCFWYKIPGDLDTNANWPRTTVTLDIINELDDIHAGFFPGGVGDLDLDFDNDNDLDIFSVEQEDDKILPLERTSRGYLWENLDGKGGYFKERVVFDQNLGGHDALFGDVDQDGDIDICFKIWKKLGTNANQGNVHAVFLENKTIQ